MPPTVISEYKALNLISPFLPEAEAHRQALIATLLYNKGCTKKSQTKTITDLFPYLDSETPDFLEDPKVKKAKTLFRAIGLQRECPDLYEASLAELIEKLHEEIDIESAKDEPDMYLIKSLQKLIGEQDGKNL